MVWPSRGGAVRYDKTIVRRVGPGMGLLRGDGDSCLVGARHRRRRTVRAGDGGGWPVGSCDGDGDADDHNGLRWDGLSELVASALREPPETPRRLWRQGLRGDDDDLRWHRLGSTGAAPYRCPYPSPDVLRRERDSDCKRRRRGVWPTRE